MQHFLFAILKLVSASKQIGLLKSPIYFLPTHILGIIVVYQMFFLCFSENLLDKAWKYSLPSSVRCFQFYLVGKEWWLRLARFMKYVEKYKATETACLFENSFKELDNVTIHHYTCCEECFLLSLLPTQKYFFLDETEHQQTDIHGLLWWKCISTCSCHSCKTMVSKICSCCI